VIRAVIDTNVLVSGLLSPSGNEALILLAIHHGLVRPCCSEDILEEYAAVLARPKFAFPPEDIVRTATCFIKMRDYDRVPAQSTARQR
jgi:putative PIN family toxin of toxin-antitoxin system